MKENNIYVVEVTSNNGPLTLAVSAPSSSQAKAHVARSMITARLAKPSEILRMSPEEVIGAEAAPAQEALPLPAPGGEQSAG